VDLFFSRPAGLFCVVSHCLTVLLPSFLPLMEEKKQKKIKASGTPAKFSWYFKTSGTLVKLAWYQAKFPAPEGAVRDAG